jgi:hypothetical protein
VFQQPPSEATSTTKNIETVERTVVDVDLALFQQQVGLHIDETIANAFASETPLIVVEKLGTLQEQMFTLILCNDWNGGDSGGSDWLLACCKLLRTIVQNAKDFNSPKYRTLKTTTKAFRSNIAAHEGALGVLLAVGFTQVAASSGVDAQVVLSREDPGLLYIAHSVLETAVQLLQAQLEEQELVRQQAQASNAVAADATATAKVGNDVSA